MDITDSFNTVVDVLNTFIVFVCYSGVTISITSEVDQSDEYNEQQEGQDEETDSPASVVNEEGDEGQDNDGQAQNVEGSDVPDWEVGSDLWVVTVSESVVSVEEDGETEEKEEGVGKEDHV